MRLPNYWIGGITVAVFFSHGLPAAGDTRIRGEFEYSVDENRLSEWQVGPSFALDDSTELEIPIGQEDNLWLIKPELTYEIEANELTIELSVGFEALFIGEPIEGFGGIEGRVDF